LKTFSDTQGRKWEIRLTIGSVERVQDMLGVNLFEPEAGDPPLLQQLGLNLRLLGEVIMCLLAPQFEKHQVSEQDVKDAFEGECLWKAQAAFYEELVDFFQTGRPNVAGAVKAQQQMIERAVQTLAKRVNPEELSKVVQEQIESEPGIDAVIRGAISGHSQAPSASTPDC